MKERTNLSDPNRYSRRIDWRKDLRSPETIVSFTMILLGIVLTNYKASDFPNDYIWLIFSFFTLSFGALFYFKFRSSGNKVYLGGVFLMVFFTLNIIAVFILNHFFGGNQSGGLP